MNKKVLVLIDGNSLMFRSYYATAYTGNLMKAKNGIYTNALFGFCNMLHNRLAGEAEYVFIAFDAGSKTFRHQSYEEYKATRKPLPDELRMQIPYIKEYLDIMNIKREESDFYEADDIIASAADKYYNSFDEIRVISGDRDLLQLVNKKVSVFLTKRGIGELEEYNADNFYKLTNIRPEQVTDYKGLVGDASDNLPGIKGIGDKTAVRLLNEYGSFVGIMENIEKLPGKTRELFLRGKEIGQRCKELATLRVDAALEYSSEDFKTQDYNYDELVEFFRRFEFYSFLKRIERPKSPDNQAVSVIIVSADSNIKDKLNDDSYIVPEVFTGNYFTGVFLGISLVLPGGHFFISKDMIKENLYLKTYLENPKYAKKTYDCKMLYSVLKGLGIEIQNVSFDLLLASYLINPSYAADDFKKTADNYYNNSLPYYENIYGANKKMRIPNIGIYSAYGVNKCLIIEKLEPELNSKIDEINLRELFGIEMALSRVLAHMEINGLFVDTERLREIGTEFNLKAEELAARIHNIAGETFNINSPKQLGDILFEKLKLPSGKKNKMGFATNVDVLEKLAGHYPIARYILEYRTYNKLITTYVNGLTDVIDKKGYIHPIYKQALTTTGRLSSVEPNIQNIPVRTPEGQTIREAFVSRFPGGYILSADYSQIELRILAHLSGDEKMISAFNESQDLHAITASQIFEVDPEHVTGDMRRTAKAINFGIIYGMSAWGLSEAINITPLEANIYINKYFDTYKNVKTYLDSLIVAARENGYSRTILNRRRYIPEIQSANANLRAAGERNAMNAPVQGSAADIIKIAMVNIGRRMEILKLRSVMTAQVHDELLFDCPADELEVMKAIVSEEMTKAYDLRVKLTVEINIGPNWSDVK